MITRAILSVLAVMFSIAQALGQLCQGSLGDPIVNITFGSGGNPGPPLAAATTNYQYLATDCPNDGQYAVRNRTDNCYNNWHTLSSDHTGNPGGYFMLVNASYQPSAFYVDTVNLLCANTVYEFAAWAINVIRNPVCAGNPAISPNLTFSIERTDGTVIQTYNTGNIPIVPTATWSQYGFFFTAPSGVNRVVLRITNNAPGGCGNDIAIDDITFRPCGPRVDVSINASGNEWKVCKGDETQLTLAAQVSSGFANPVMQWQLSNNNGITWADVPLANASNLNIAITAATPIGTYLYRMSVAEFENAAIPLCRVNSPTLKISVLPKPVTTKSTNSPVCRNAELRFEAGGGVSYDWSGPNGFTSTSASVLISDAQENMSGKYYVTITDANNCTNLDSVIVEVQPRPTAISAPEAVTICEGVPVQISASGGSSYLWSPSDGLSATDITDPIATPVDTTEYMVIVKNDIGCSDSAYSTVNVLKLPRANAGADKEMFQGESAILNGFVEGSSVSHTWTPDYFINDLNSIDPQVSPAVDTSYILTVTSEVGCGISRDTVQVKVYKGIFVPTAFTPNADGLNDEWKVPGLGIFNDHEVFVFNRYGQVVFSTKANKSWDGTLKGEPQPSGAYPYLIKVKERNILLKGVLILIR